MQQPQDPHATTPDEVLAALGADSDGLTTDEAQQRLADFGPNELPQGKRQPLILKVLKHFNDPLIYLLIVAAVVMALTGHVVDTVVIMIVVLVNGAIGYVQEGQAESAMEGIREMLSASAWARRDGSWEQVPAERIVPGDIVRLEAGDRVAADARIVEASNLQVDEAALTGESEPADKSTDSVAADDALGDRSSMVYSGTMVAAGNGIALVTTTGADTEIGRINALVSQVETIATPLTRAMGKLSKQLTVVILVAAVLLFAFSWFVHQQPFDELFRAVISFSVGMIPEGLPAIMTITLARGVQLMAKRNAITRQLNSVETLGSVTTICSDKTGTLTRNEMTVRSLVTVGGTFEVTGTGYEPVGEIQRDGEAVSVDDDRGVTALLQIASRANDAAVREKDGRWQLLGAPTDGGLRVVALKAGVDPGADDRTMELPFDSEHKYMATLDETDEGRIVHLKGAPDRLLDRCSYQGDEVTADQPLDREHWERLIDDLGSQGLRVLAGAIRSFDGDDVTREDVDEGGFVFVGLYGIIDPPRDEAIEAIESSQQAGITVKMITGDHAGTALAIGSQMGIGDGQTAMTGEQLEACSDEELRQVVQETDVFARTSPEHKLRIVRALQANGEVTAMTGDGVNDAPSLKQSDVGVAMGQKGTEATKEAADIVLADDNFATIQRAVQQGRTIYDNLRKSILFILPTNGAEGLVIAVAIIAGFTLPMTPLQILWVNLVIAITLAFALAFEPSEPDVMQRPPRSPDENILNAAGIFRIVFLTVVLAGAALVLFWVMYDDGQGDLALARTLTLNALVFAQAFYLFNVRFLRGTSFRKEVFTTNPIAWLSVAALMVLQLVLIYVPFMQQTFQVAPLPWWGWLLTLGIGAVVFVVVEVEKLIRRRLDRTP